LIVDFFVDVFDSDHNILEELFSDGFVLALMTLGVMNEFALKVFFDKVLMYVLLTFGAEGFL
jgi:hypothetical protein